MKAYPYVLAQRKQQTVAGGETDRRGTEGRRIRVYQQGRNPGRHQVRTGGFEGRTKKAVRRTNKGTGRCSINRVFGYF